MGDGQRQVAKGKSRCGQAPQVAATSRKKDALVTGQRQPPHPHQHLFAPLSPVYLAFVDNVLARCTFSTLNTGRFAPAATMSLAEETGTRKARLLALRRRKLGQNGEDLRRVVVIEGILPLTHDFSSEPRPEHVISTRNFDPETRTLRKRTTADDDAQMEDTVEKNVAGLAEAIVAEDEAKRAEELVRLLQLLCPHPSTQPSSRIY